MEQKLTKVEAKARYGNTPQKKHPKSGFGAILGSILGAKMLPKRCQKRSKKYAEKRHQKKRPPGSIFDHKSEQNGSFFLSKWDVLSIKCWPQSKSRNLEQTLALRMYTKGSDPPKMQLFRAFACKKRVPERGEEKDRKKIALGTILDQLWLPCRLHFGTKM